MIIKLKNGKYYDARSYGIETWGTVYQRNMFRLCEKWYQIQSICVDEEDNIWEQEEILLDVEEEFEEPPVGIKLENEEDYLVFNNFMQGDLDEEKITE